MTEMGRDLLGQDYILKQITASLMHPDSEIGKKFWAEVYKRAWEKYGTSDVPVDTFNKVWIVPDKAVVYERAQGIGHRAQENPLPTRGHAAQGLPSVYPSTQPTSQGLNVGATQGSSDGQAGISALDRGEPS